VEPKFTYNYKTLLRTSVSYGFTQKKNEINLGGEKTLANKLELELRYSKATKNTLETKFTLAIVKYTGENGTTKSYTILEGLQPGNNYIWSGTYTRNISQNLELSLTYEGRKTGTAKLVNTGRAQLRAVF
jgi:predicted ATPase